MSSVTDIILITTTDDGISDSSSQPNADIINTYIKENFQGCKLVKVDPYTDDKKSMQCDIFMCAVEGLDTEELIEIFNSIHWQQPGSVQLILKEPQDDAFSIHSPVQTFSPQ
ncbi:MAG: hypothetical protein V7731_18150 [Amphritea sp.]